MSSFFTRASAGEYGVYTLVAVGASYVEVVGMCVVTNLRYLLMGAALTQKFADGTSLLKRLLVSGCITDEVFGISIAYKGKLAPAYTIGAMLISGTFWAGGTMAGIMAGGVFPPNILSALSVALYGMFIAVIIPPAKKDTAVCGAVLASFLVSWLCSIIPAVSQVSPGTRTILLTVVISSIAAWLKPIKVRDYA